MAGLGKEDKCNGAGIPGNTTEACETTAKQQGFHEPSYSSGYKEGFNHAEKLSRDPIEEMFSYHSPNTEHLLRMEAIRDAAKLFVRAVLKHTPRGRDQRAVIRKIREAAMTANQSVLLGDIHF